MDIPASRVDMWSDVLSEVFDAEETLHIKQLIDELPTDALRRVAVAIAECADAEGDFDAPVPSSTDLEDIRVRETEKRMQRRIDSLEQDHEIHRKFIARQYGAEARHVNINNLGQVEIYQR